MTYSDAISGRLKELIKRKGITVNKLATQSGITQSTVESSGMKSRRKSKKIS